MARAVQPVTGVAEAGLGALVDAVGECGQLALECLMTIPPPVPDPEQSRPWFRRLAGLRDETARRTGLALPHLSMGMSGDFEVAIEEGATLVRVGSAIFGPRGVSG